MRRWVFNIFSVVSFAFCIVIAMAWVRSYFVEDAFSYGKTWATWDAGLTKSNSLKRSVSIACGGVQVQRIDYYFDYAVKLPPDGFGYSHSTVRHLDELSDHPGGLWMRLGFGVSEYAGGDLGMLSDGWSVTTPLWLLFVLASVLPVTGIVARIRATRRMPGTCRSCGYDLRATRDRCPECGAMNPPTLEAVADPFILR